MIFLPNLEHVAKTHVSVDLAIHDILQIYDVDNLMYLDPVWIGVFYLL